MKQIIFLSLIAFTPAVFFAQDTNTAKAKELVSKMTLDEKASLVVGLGMKLPGLNPADGALVGQTMDKVAGAAGTTFAIEHLGIPPQ